MAKLKSSDQPSTTSRSRKSGKITREQIIADLIDAFGVDNPIREDEITVRQMVDEGITKARAQKIIARAVKSKTWVGRWCVDPRDGRRVMAYKSVIDNK